MQNQLVNLNPTKREKELKLEQLRWMDHSYEIGIHETLYISPSIDMPEDIQKVIEHLNQ